MDLQKLIIKERQSKPPRIVLHGIHKVGKSTWASGAPDPIFIITEDGLIDIDVDHFPLATDLETFFQYLETILGSEHSYKTCVIDTVDWLEKLIWKQVCIDHNVKNIDQIGYYKGYQFAMTHWQRFFDTMNQIRDREMACIILAHNEVKSVNLPDVEPYDRYSIKIHKYPAPMLEEWADIILFARFVVYVDKEKAVSSGERVIHTQPSPAWAAGSRYPLPEKLDMKFKTLMEEIKNGRFK